MTNPFQNIWPAVTEAEVDAELARQGVDGRRFFAYAGPKAYGAFRSSVKGQLRRNKRRGGGSVSLLPWSARRRTQ